MKLIIATTNEGKLKEFKEKLAHLDLEILSIKDIDKNIDSNENGSTYAENAVIKSRTLCDLTKEICVSDDSGLEIEAMPGELGIHTARFLGEKTPYEEKMKEILKRMENVPFDKRKAVFKCVMSMSLPNGEDILFDGELKGYIHNKIMTGIGFGYDPIFYLPEYNKTSGEIGIEEKNKISHRGLALQKLEKYLKERYLKDKADE